MNQVIKHNNPCIKLTCTSSPIKLQILFVKISPYTFYVSWVFKITFFIKIFFDFTQKLLEVENIIKCRKFFFTLLHGKMSIFCCFIHFSRKKNLFHVPQYLLFTEKFFRNRENLTEKTPTKISSVTKIQLRPLFLKIELQIDIFEISIA